jgi:hypothetical protein
MVGTAGGLSLGVGPYSTVFSRKPTGKTSYSNLQLYRASHIRFISEFILYATKNTNYADHLIPFIM